MLSYTFIKRHSQVSDPGPESPLVLVMLSISDHPRGMSPRYEAVVFVTMSSCFYRFLDL